jgi:hypothetical protein
MVLDHIHHITLSITIRINRIYIYFKIKYKPISVHVAFNASKIPTNNIGAAKKFSRKKVIDTIEKKYLAIIVHKIK